MNREKKEIVLTMTDGILATLFTDAQDRAQAVEAIIEDVVQDIEETADENFSLGDISIAIQRTVLERLTRKLPHESCPLLH